MKKSAVMFLMLSMFFVASVAMAAEKTAYVDTQAVFEKTSLGKKYQGIVKEYYESRKKVLDADASDIQKLQADFKKQKDAKMLNESALKKKEETINRKIGDFQKKQEEFSTEIGKKQAELFGDFNQKMMAVLKKVAKKEKASMVLSKSMVIARSEAPLVVYADEDLDLTELVISEMDKSEPGK